jgi:hypothetical protein
VNDAPTPACIVCRHDLYADEWDRYCCRPCQDRIDADLATLAGPATWHDGHLVSGLFAALPTELEPSSGSRGPRVSGSKSAPAPARMDPLSQSAHGGLVNDLEEWVGDWESRGYATRCRAVRPQYRMDQAVATLRFNLDTAVRRHEAISSFAEDVRTIRGTCEGLIVGARPPKPLHAACHCGTRITFNLNTEYRHCKGCGTDYGHTALIELVLAERRAA